jgi:hypothetical protein
MYQTWRDLLALLIEKPRERARLAKAIGVSALTLQCWATHESDPQPQQQQRMLQALPQHAMLLRALLAEEFNTFDAEPGTPLNDPLLEFSTRIFAIHASAPDEARYWSICTAVLSEAIAQLDPQNSGISLSVIQCMAPSQASHVRYLRECASLGTSPWPTQIEFRTSFLGAESLAGHAVATALPQIVVDSRQEPHAARRLPEHATSAIALPILHTGRIAGCLCAVSIQPNYFSDPTLVELLQNYAALLKLAFSPEQFYPIEQITLESMPPLQAQRPYLSSCQQRVLATLKTAFMGNHSLNYLEAQHYVWGQIAEELLQLQTPQV